MTPLAQSPSRSWLTRWWQELSPVSRTFLVLLIAPLLVLNVWAIAQIFEYFREILVAVLVAALLAFLLSYPVGWLHRLRIRRGIAS
ncbi:MAG: AI-2E family transporter, partial [Cyanobacteria bacterium J06639_14]